MQTPISSMKVKKVHGRHLGSCSVGKSSEVVEMMVEVEWSVRPAWNQILHVSFTATKHVQSISYYSSIRKPDFRIPEMLSFREMKGFCERAEANNSNSATRHNNTDQDLTSFKRPHCHLWSSAGLWWARRCFVSLTVVIDPSGDPIPLPWKLPRG